MTIQDHMHAYARSTRWCSLTALSALLLVGCGGVDPEAIAGETSELRVAESGLSSRGALAAGKVHTCALGGDGTVRCWGYNNWGELGNGTQTNRTISVVVSGLTGVSAMTAGGYHTCALLAGGTARCWGNNYSGQLGDGTTTQHLIPVAVSGLTKRDRGHGR